MKAQVIDQQQPANGTQPPSTGSGHGFDKLRTQPLTPEAKLAAFQQELEALTNKYSVRLVAYIIRFNDGTQIADAKYIPVER